MEEILKKLKAIFKVPMLIVFVVICFMFLPTAINMRSAVFRSAIVVAFGIDVNEQNNYVVNAAINVSATAESLSENTKLISADGNSVSDAISTLAVQFGRPIRFGHTRFVLIGRKLAEQNIAVALDGIIRTNKMRDTVQLIFCDAKIEDMLNVGIEIKNKTGIKMSEIVTYQSKFSTTTMDSNIDSFYKGYFSSSGISKINCIKLTDDFSKGITPDAALGEIEISDEENQSSQSAGGSSAGSNETSGQSNKKSKKYLSNTGEVAVFKKGVLQNIIQNDLVNGTYWINSAHFPQKVSINATNKFLKDSRIHFYVLDKTVTKEVFFYKNIPTISAKINVTLGIDEILNKDGTVTSLSTDVIDQNVKCEIGREIRRQTGNALLYGKENNLDILELNEIFYLSKYKDYIKYLNSGNSIIDLLQNLQLSLEVRIEVI